MLDEQLPDADEEEEDDDARDAPMQAASSSSRREGGREGIVARESGGEERTTSAEIRLLGSSVSTKEVASGPHCRSSASSDMVYVVNRQITGDR